MRHAASAFTFPIESWTAATKTLLLYGATNVGKTSLAKALLPRALIVSHMDHLKQYEKGANYGIIYDDMSFAHIPREAQLHLVDRGEDRQIQIRYYIACIPRETPVIITTNKEPREILLTEDPAIARRILAVRMVSPTEYVLNETLEFHWTSQIPPKDKGKEKESEFYNKEDVFNF